MAGNGRMGAVVSKGSRKLRLLFVPLNVLKAMTSRRCRRGALDAMCESEGEHIRLRALNRKRD